MDRTVSINTRLPENLRKIAFLVVLKVSIDHWRERSCMLHLSANTFPEINLSVCHVLHLPLFSVNGSIWDQSETVLLDSCPFAMNSSVNLL
jgi:hypothetical protein